MPMISIETILRTVAEQEQQIRELKRQVALLEAQLETRDRVRLAQELVDLVRDYPGSVRYPIVASTEKH